MISGLLGVNLESHKIRIIEPISISNLAWINWFGAIKNPSASTLERCKCLQIYLDLVAQVVSKLEYNEEIPANTSVMIFPHIALPFYVQDIATGFPLFCLDVQSPQNKDD